MRLVGQDDVALDGLELRRDPLDEGYEGEVEENDPVLRMVDDIGDLILEKASDQELAWNIGTTISETSRDEMRKLSDMHATSEWSTFERWL